MIDLVVLCLTFVAVFIVVSRWHNVALAMLAGIIVINLASPGPISFFVGTARKVMFDISSWELVAVVILITVLSATLEKTGLMAMIVDSLQLIFRSTHILLVIIPTFLGTLVVPGGAVMSAPLVKQLGSRLQMDPGSMAGVNIFFRHAVYFFYPLSMVMILVSEISGLGFVSIVKFNAVPLVISLAIAFIYIKKSWPESVPDTTIAATIAEGARQNSLLKGLKGFLLGASPFIVALTLGIGFKINFAVALVLAIIQAIAADAYLKRSLQLPRYLSYVCKGANWRLGLTVLTILLFGAFVRQSEGIAYLTDYIVASNIPLIILAIVFPIFISFTVGHAMAAASILYPIFLPLVPPGAEGVTYLALIYSGMLYGYIISPVHLCLSVTSEYFQVGFRESYRLLFPLQTVYMIAAIIFALLMLS